MLTVRSWRTAPNRCRTKWRSDYCYRVATGIALHEENKLMRTRL